MARKAKFTTKMRFNTNTKQNELQTGGSGWVVAGPDSGLRLSAQLSEAKTGNFPFLDRNFEAAMSRTNLLCFRGSRRFFSACGVVCPRPVRVTLSPRRSPGDQGCGLRPHLTVRSWWPTRIFWRCVQVTWGKKNNLTKRELIHLIKITQITDTRDKVLFVQLIELSFY